MTVSQRVVAVRALLLGLTIFAAACSEDDQVDLTATCDPDRRLTMAGIIGPSSYDTVGLPDAYPGRMGTDFFDLVLQGGDDPHLIAFSTRGSAAPDIRAALRSRLDSGAANAGTLDVVTRPDTVPCDPAEGVICASYGIDVNGDGVLVGSNEVIYPADGGSITFTEVSGNVFAAGYSISFGAQVSGAPEEGGDQGGAITGCFRLNINAAVTEVR